MRKKKRQPFGRCAFGYECSQKHVMPLAPLRQLSEEEASRVVLPKLGRLYIECNGSMTNVKAHAAYCASNGDGSMRRPLKGEDWIDDPVNRYLEAMGAGGCCDIGSPCPRHIGPLLGRNWRTGAYGEEA